MIVAVPNTICDREGNAKNNKMVNIRIEYVKGESGSSVDELTQSTPLMKNILYS